jgi:hypothetical protein
LSLSCQILPTDHVSTTSTRSYNDADKRDRSKERLRNLLIPPLPLNIKDLKNWNEQLEWNLSGQHWCDIDGTHACNIPATTHANRSLSHNFMVVLKRLAMAHKSTEHQRSATALLQEVPLGVHGNALIKSGQGFELYQSPVKTGFL